MMRPIFASRELGDRMKVKEESRVNVYSFFPVDPGDCACASIIEEWKDKLRMMNDRDRKTVIQNTNHLECTRDKTGMKRYTITCNNCGEIQGYCWAKDATLTDFCDFHYYQWCDGELWHGCLTPNISPIDQSLTLECCCGQDSRDFRANKTLSPLRADSIERSNRIGRRYNQANSKFSVSEVAHG